jgi:hypothetical protein
VINLVVPLVSVAVFHPVGSGLHWVGNLILWISLCLCFWSSLLLSVFLIGVSDLVLTYIPLVKYGCTDLCWLFGEDPAGSSVFGVGSFYPAGFSFQSA